MSKIRRLRAGVTPDDSEVEAGAGHNSHGLNGATKQVLRGIVSELDRVDDDRSDLNEQAKEIRARAKALGFDTKALNTARKLLSQDKTEREDFEATVDIYMIALEEQI